MPDTHIITLAQATGYMETLRRRFADDPAMTAIFANNSFGGTIQLEDIAGYNQASLIRTGLKGWLGFNKNSEQLYVMFQLTSNYDTTNPDSVRDIADKLMKPNNTGNLFGWNDLEGNSWFEKLGSVPQKNAASTSQTWTQALQGFKDFIESFPEENAAHRTASIFFDDLNGMPFRQWIEQGDASGNSVTSIRFFFGWDESLESTGYALRVLIFPVNGNNSTTLSYADGKEVKVLQRSWPPIP